LAISWIGDFNFGLLVRKLFGLGLVEFSSKNWVKGEGRIKDWVKTQKFWAGKNQNCV